MTGVRVGIDAMPVAADPRWPSDLNGRLVGDGLLRPVVEPTDDGVSLGCASRLSCDAEGRRWYAEFDCDTLRWSDGVAFTVDDVVRSAAEVAARPRSPAAGWLGGDKATVRAMDAATVEYDFGVPTGFAPAVLSMAPFAPSRAGAFSWSTVPVLGPYRPGMADAEQRELVLREDVAQPAGAPERVRFCLAAEPEAAITRFADRDLDITPTTSFGAEQLNSLAGRPELVSRDIALFGSLEFGRDAGQLRHSPELRRTLSDLLDRAAACAPAGPVAAPSISPSALWSGTDTGALTAPGTAAIAALRKACADGLTVDYADFVPNGEVVKAIADQLSAALGVPVLVRGHTFPEYLKRVVSRDHCLLYTLTAPDFAHPAAMLAPWTSTGAQARHAGFSDPELDRRVAAARDRTDHAQAMSAWAHADARWCEVVPRIPVLRESAHCLWSPHVAGTGLLPDGTIPIRTLAVNDD